MKTFRLAAVQPESDKDDREIVCDIKEYIRRAAAKHAHMVCFPEAAIADTPKKNRKAISEIAELCKENEIYCIITTRLREKKHVYNTSVLIDDEGRISGKHKKVHLLGDAKSVKPGSSFEIYDTKFCRIGIAICWDVSDPDAVYAMAEKGADLIVCPMYWAFDEWAHRRDHKKFEKKVLQSLILSRAYDNLVYVVFCNHYDTSNPENTPYTAIAEPHRIMKDIFDREGMIIAEIDLDYLRKIRKKYRREYGKEISS